VARRPAPFRAPIGSVPDARSWRPPDAPSRQAGGRHHFNGAQLQTDTRYRTEPSCQPNKTWLGWTTGRSAPARDGIRRPSWVRTWSPAVERPSRPSTGHSDCPWRSRVVAMRGSPSLPPHLPPSHDVATMDWAKPPVRSAVDRPSRSATGVHCSASGWPYLLCRLVARAGWMRRPSLHDAPNPGCLDERSLGAT